MPYTIQRPDSSVTGDMSVSSRWVFSESHTGDTSGQQTLRVDMAAARRIAATLEARGNPARGVTIPAPRLTTPAHRPQVVSAGVQEALRALREGRRRAASAMETAKVAARNAVRMQGAEHDVRHGWTVKDYKTYYAARRAFGLFTKMLLKGRLPQEACMAPPGSSAAVREEVTQVFLRRRRQNSLYEDNNVAASDCLCCGSRFLYLRPPRTAVAPLCHECVVAGVLTTPDGRHFRSEAHAIEHGYETMTVLSQAGTESRTLVPTDYTRSYSRRDGRRVTLPGVESAWVDQPMLGYHSGVGRDCLNLTAEVTTGTEIEWNAGSRENGGVLGRAANIRWLQRNGLTVERDGSVTGFEMVTGHGLPRDVRDVLHPVYAMRAHTLAGLRTGGQTGQHVHVTFDRHNADAVQRLREAAGTNDRTYLNMDAPAMRLYKLAAGREHNSYCPLTLSTGHRTAIGVRDNTLEFRLFRNPGRLPMTMRNVQLAWTMVRFIQKASADFNFNSYTDFVGDMPMEDTLELRAWLNTLRGMTEARELPVEAKMSRQYYGRASLV